MPGLIIASPLFNNLAQHTLIAVRDLGDAVPENLIADHLEARKGRTRAFDIADPIAYDVA